MSTSGLVFFNTVVSGASSGLFTFMCRSYHGEKPKKCMISMCKGILAGLVGIAASCHNVYPWAAFIIGILSGGMYMLHSKLARYMKVDDPLDAFAVHYGAGFTGVLSVAFFDISYGLFHGNGGKQIWV